jgi:DNA-binding CsgD family transcriptional regulator
MISRPISAKRFVGRVRERAFVDERLDAAARGEGSVVLMFGDAGLGKTRLLRERFDAAQSRGFIDAWATNYAYASAAFAPLAEAFTRIAAAVPSALPVVGSGRRLFERFLDAFDETEGAVKEPWQKRRLFVVVADVLARAARSAPIMLVVDDAQWTDPESLELLQYLATRIERERVVLAVIAREEARKSGGAFGDAVAAFERAQWCYRAILGELSPAETRELVFTAIPPSRTLAQRTIDEIVRRSEGNPLFAEDLVRDALDTASGAKGLPGSVEQSVRRRLEQMPAADAASLEVAAAIGTSFDESLFAEIAGLDAAGARRVLRRACELNLVDDDAPDGGDMRFRHQLTRDAVYDRLVTTEQSDVHARIAAALDRRGNAAASLLAYHWQRAGDGPRAARYAEQAGDDETRRFAFGSARDHFETALEIGELDEEHRAAILCKLGQAYDLLGAPQAYPAYERALAFYRQRGDLSAIVQISMHLAHAAWRSANQERALAHAREVIEQSAADDPARFAAEALCGMYLAFAGNVDAARAHFDAADAFGGAREPADVVWLWLGRVALCFHLGRVDEWRTTAARCLAEADAAGDPNRRVTCLVDIGGYANELAELELAADHLDRAIRIGDDYGMVGKAAYARVTAANVAYTRGDLVAAHALIQAACSSAVEAQLLRLYASFVGIPIALALDDAALVERLADRHLLDEAIATGSDELAIAMLSAHAQLSDALGDRSQAASFVSRILDTSGSPYAASLDLVAIARLASEADVPRVAALLAVPTQTKPLARLHRDLAEATLLARTQPATARAATFRDAIRLARDIGARMLEATALELAGEPAAALEIYRSSGAKREVARLERETRGTSRDGKELTKREREIARLVATGQSNRAIADRLTISERTAEHHVASIFAKLAIHSRVELAARVAAERDAGNDGLAPTASSPGARSGSAYRPRRSPSP